MFGYLSAFRKCHHIHIMVHSRDQCGSEDEHRPRSIIKPLKTDLRIDVQKQITRNRYQTFRLFELIVVFQPLMFRSQPLNHFNKNRLVPGDQQPVVDQAKDDGSVLIGRKDISRQSGNRGRMTTVRELLSNDVIHQLLKPCLIRHFQQDSSHQRFRDGILINDNFGSCYELIEILRIDAERSGLTDVISKCSSNGPISSKLIEEPPQAGKFQSRGQVTDRLGTCHCKPLPAQWSVTLVCAGRGKYRVSQAGSFDCRRCHNSLTAVRGLLPGELPDRPATQIKKRTSAREQQEVIRCSYVRATLLKQL